MERRAAIKTGQEVDRQDINLRGKAHDQVEVLKMAFTFEELNAMQARVQDLIYAEQGKSAPPANIIDVKPILEDGDRHDSTAPDTGSAEGKRPSWRD